MHLSGLVITLPVLLSVSFLAGQSTSASAAALDAAQSTEMLAKAHVVDGNCKVLSSADNQELRDFTARAEISLAEKQSVKAARSAIAGGKASGQAMACDATASNFVNSVLRAARGAVDAMAKVEVPAAKPIEPSALQVAAVEPQAIAEPIAAAKPQEQAATVITPTKPKMVKLPKKTAAALQPKQPAAEAQIAKDLDSYASVAKRYYVELRCRSMSQTHINRLYANVLSAHRKAIAGNNPQSVKSMLNNVQSRAAKVSCT